MLNVDFADFLCKICPCARARHLAMFQNWVTEYGRFREEEKAVEFYSTAADSFQAKDGMPIIPDPELKSLEAEFCRLDLDHDGHITVFELQDGWGWTMQQALDTMEAFDITQDEVIDLAEFLRMMCPPEHRLPEMSGLGREVIGRLFKTTVVQRKSTLKDQAIQFETAEVMRTQWSVPTSILPEVTDRLLASWNQVWDNLNASGGDRVTLQDLENSGLISRSECPALMQIVDPGNKDGFSRQAFVVALSRAHGFRPRFEDAVYAHGHSGGAAN